MKFVVIDKNGNRVTIEDVFRENPDWIKALVYKRANDLEFAVGQSGELYLLDDCGNWVSCMEDWEVIFDDRRCLGHSVE